MNFFDHLEEFRSRILRSVFFITVCFIILWFFKDDLLNVYLIQINAIIRETGGGIILLKFTDKFFIHLKTVFFFSIFLTFPYLYWQAWAFLKPALYGREKKYFSVVFFSSLLFLYLGILTAYFLLMPAGFRFLAEYSSVSNPFFIETELPVKLAVSLKEQIHLTQSIILIFACIFQTPLIVLCLIKTGLIRAEIIKHYRKHVMVVCFIIAAILTPPDPVSQCIMAFPLILLFELGLILNTLLNWIGKKGNS
ncbi:MAG: twin-arginine translocase subunit TatC [Candidatus Aureabacteria bacterium]|nr:twin-arginine translocase subunit TatC [Candidatus Auribacterota bacterium]